MIISAPNWVGTGITAIKGTRGLSGCRRRRGFGQDDGSGSISSQDVAALVGSSSLDATGSSTLATGVLPLATSTSASGGYSVNPSSGQLVANLIPGVSNSTLLLGGAFLIGFAMFAGAFKK